MKGKDEKDGSTIILNYSISANGKILVIDYPDDFKKLAYSEGVRQPHAIWFNKQ